MNVFLSCVSEKEDHKCAAKDLYISPLFQKSYAYAQKLNPDHIYILSAKYFVVDLDEEISPYDVTLKDMNADEKREWVDNVLKKMDEKGIDRNEKTIFLAGHAYLDYLVEHFSDYSIPYQDAGLEGIGHILHWLDEQIGLEMASQIDEKYQKKLADIQLNKANHMSLINRLKLAKMLMQFAEIETDKGKLTYEGELAEGTEVFIEIEGELTPAPDGDYRTDDQIITVAEGKVSKIEIVETEDPEGEGKGEGEGAPEENFDEKDDRIAELEAKVTELEAIIAERDARIAELEAQLVEKDEQLQMSVAKPAHKEIKDIVITNKENKALKYFQK